MVFWSNLLQQQTVSNSTHRFLISSQFQRFSLPIYRFGHTWQQYQKRILKRKAQQEKEQSFLELHKDKKWRILSSLVVERLPLVEVLPPEWEKDYFDMKFKHQQIICSTLEKWKAEKKKKQASEKKNKKIPSDSEATNKSNKSNKLNKSNKSKPDIPPETITELQISRITIDDLNNNQKSFNRKIDDSLFLLLQKHREEHAWQFPQTEWSEGSTMREVLEKHIASSVGKEFKVTFTSNAPMGHLLLIYPEEYYKKTGYFGAKIFFYRSRYLQGKIRLNRNIFSDYIWVTSSELQNFFTEDYFHFFHKLL